MRALLIAICCLSQMIAFANLGHAASEHEMSVGAQKEQICSASTIDIVGKFLQIEAFKIPPRGYSPNAKAIIASAACKASPNNKQISIVAIAYESDKENTKAFIVALVDESKRAVISSLQSEIGEDAAMRVESGSLWIDTAPYRLSSNVRAFGVDLTSGYIPHCGDGGSGADRTLYVQEGARLRPILGATMSYWSFIQGGNPRCMAYDKVPSETVIENIDLTISVASTTTNGYRDIIVTAFRSRDDAKPARNQLFRYTLHYDGNEYPTKDMTERFYKWYR